MPVYRRSVVQSSGFIRFSPVSIDKTAEKAFEVGKDPSVLG
jgi:hypothetical protein